MHLNINLVALSFIVIIIIIYLADSLSTAVIIITLIVNFVVICVHLSNIDCCDSSSQQLGGAAANPTAATDIGPPVMALMPAQPMVPGEGGDYGSAYDIYAHANEYTPEPSVFPLQYGPAEGVVGVDSAATIIAQRRARDKRAMTAAATKTADYYKYAFGDELSSAEAKRWWGENEY